MAEIVASGITIGALTTGIATSIVKLKAFWDQVQDVPEDIHNLIEELEIHSSLIAEIEKGLQRNPTSSLILDSTITLKCLQLCKQGASRLKDVVDQLDADLKASSKFKRKRTYVKAMLKNAQLDRYKARMESALRLLSLSHQSYMG